ncbi:hypothetical protein J1N35_031449 [Gossypium stocksii]|uniref:RNase H type-1 domain-containing protein n=1 Tax=Gossypium stocksii TaxID=47602 RepID=A0A9D3V2L3_9ROSI|nr:hypothetical protein J1N35_031449 [Gossypium stocksii]
MKILQREKARSGSGSFSIRSVYSALKENFWNPNDDKLLTNPERIRRGIRQSSACPLCGHDFEDLLHVLRDCVMAKEAWMIVVPTEKLSSFFLLFSNLSLESLEMLQQEVWLGIEVMFTIEAELWGIIDGILILLSKGYKKVQIQSDNLEVVRALSMEGAEDFGINLLRRIKRLLRSKGQWNVNHVLRECNLIADQLAKISLS